MDIIELAREIGKELQKNEQYIKMNMAMQKLDADEAMQNLIGQYNLRRMSLGTEMNKTDRDNDKIQAYQQEMNSLYESIMANGDMTAYQEAKQEVDHILQRVNAIIEKSANGEDPETADYTESCGGNCSSCGGCH